MRRSIVVPILALIVGLVPPGAEAQDAGAPVAPPPRSERVYDGPLLGLPEAVREALDRHPDLAALRAREVAARARPDTERFLMPPVLEAQIFQWPFDTINPGDAQMMFTLEQELPGRGKRPLRVDRAEREAAVTAAHVQVRALEVAAEVKLAYADLWLARQTLDTYAAGIALLRELARLAEARYVTGRISQQDIVKAIVERSRLEEGVVRATEAARLAEARLNSLLQRTLESPIGPLSEPLDELTLPSTADLQARAVARHPELAVAARAVAASEGELAVAASERRPDYRVRGGFMLMPDMTNAWTASVGVTWPGAPWARKRIDATVREAAARREADVAEQRAIETRVRLRVQEAHVRARSAIERADLLRTSVRPQAEHVLEIARAAYQTDRLDLIEVIDAERTLLASRLDVQMAIADRERALAELELAVGEDIRWTPGQAAGGSR